MRTKEGTICAITRCNSTHNVHICTRYTLTFWCAVSVWAYKQTSFVCLLLLLLGPRSVFSLPYIQNRQPERTNKHTYAVWIENHSRTFIYCASIVNALFDAHAFGWALYTHAFFLINFLVQNKNKTFFFVVFYRKRKKAKKKKRVNKVKQKGEKTTKSSDDETCHTQSYT